MKCEFCPRCGGHGFCQPGCSVSTPLMQYHQRTLWYLRIMLQFAKSERQQAYWASEVLAAEDQLEAAFVASYSMRKAA